MEQVKIKIHCTINGVNGCFVTDKNEKLITPIFQSAYELFLSDEYKALEIEHRSNYAYVKTS